MARRNTTSTKQATKRAAGSHSAVTTSPASVPSTKPRMAAYDGIYRASFRYPPYSLDTLVANLGWDIADTMLTSAACRAPFNVKRYAVLSEDWKIVPAVTDPYDSRNGPATEYADFARWCFSNILSEAGAQQDFRAVLFEVLRGLWDGFRVSEIGYRYLEDGPYAGKFGYDGFYAKHAKQIGFDIDPFTGQVWHVTSYTPGGSYLPDNYGSVPNIQGGYDFTVPVEKVIHYVYNPDASLPFGWGDWRGNYKHWFVLDNSQRIWAIALERWGAPVLIAQGPENNLAAIQQTLDGIRQGAAAALPENVKYQIAQVASSVFEAMRLACQWHTSQIAYNIQSNILTGGEGEHGSTSAGAETHQDTGDYVYDFARRDLEGVIGMQVIRRLCQINFPGFDTTLTPRLDIGGDKVEDRFQLMQAFDLAIKDGVIWKGAKFVREEMGWPPMDPEEVQGIAAEAAAQQEAAQQLADARNSGKTGAMNAAQVKSALAILATAILAREELKAA